MKKNMVMGLALVVSIAFSLTLPVAVSAQSASLDRFCAKYKSSGENGLSISGDPNFLISACFKGDGSETGSWLKRVKQVQVLILDKEHGPSPREWSDLSSGLHEDRFEELVSIRKGHDRVQLMSADRAEGGKEIVFLASGEENGGMLVRFSGRFTSRDLEKMQEAIQNKK